MSDDLLPANRSRLESALAIAMAPRPDPAAIGFLWDPLRCPLALLPWLAWALAVDDWDENWHETAKRQTIAAALDIHRRRGTPYAVKRALEAIGLTPALTEWFDYGGDPGYFKLDIALDEDGIDAATFDRMLAKIDSYKNVRSHLERLTLALINRSAVPAIATALLCGEVASVYPLDLTEIDQGSQVPGLGIGHWSIETTTVFPSS